MIMIMHCQTNISPYILLCLDCKEPSSDNAKVIVYSTVLGSVALYSCDKGMWRE